MTQQQITNQLRSDVICWVLSGCAAAGCWPGAAPQSLTLSVWGDRLPVLPAMTRTDGQPRPAPGSPPPPLGAVTAVANRTNTRGGRKNKTRKRRTSAPARNKKYVRTFFIFFILFLVRFWAFLGKGSSKTREKPFSTFQKKSPMKYFFRGGIFFWVIFFKSFSFRCFCCVG
jgi:hypothetical protein